MRIALWGGGIITFVAGFFAWHSIRKAERVAAAAGEETVPEEGPLEFVPLGLIEPSPIAAPDAETDDAEADDADDEEEPDAGAAT